MAGQLNPNTGKRLVQRFVEGDTWETVEIKDLHEGDVFRMDGMAHQSFKALGNPYQDPKLDWTIDATLKLSDALR